LAAVYTNFEQIPPRLQGLDTNVVYIAPDGNVTHLNGTLAGAEGARLYQQLQGEQHLPFEQVITESAYQLGATIERTNYPKRLINFRVVIYGQTAYQYQMADNRFWSGQDELHDGWLGIGTRFTGMRWIPVRPFKTIDTAQKMDPIAYGNNLAIWDINWISQRPYYSKPSLLGTWMAKGSGQPDKHGNYTGTITLANRGDLATNVQYMISGAGVATVQDNNSNVMVALPELIASDGTGLCDTTPENRTLTASNDPVDNQFYNWLASSKILNFFLTNLTQSAEPWWERGYVRFLYSVPPQSVVTLNVAHTNPAAVITALLPQKYKRSR
jgi:hypothetical protein